MDSTDGHLLDGRVRYAQPAGGFRSGIEPVLLAAAIPAREGERVLEGGSGAGAGLLCLAARVAGVRGLGIERDPSLAALAQRNAIANGWTSLTFLAAAVEAIPESGPFDHAFANPPYHLSAGTPSPVPERAQAKHAPADLLAVWATSLARRLRPRGTLTLIAPAADLPACLTAFAAARCGSGCLFPLWPRQGRPAKLALLQGVKDGRGPFRILPGLVLHGGEGSGYTPEAEAVLRDAAALPIGGQASPRSG
jgi:tRNA1(Val) A37 N6-methylase TrmN6